MKKMMNLLLAFAMLFSITSTALAADVTSTDADDMKATVSAGALGIDPQAWGGKAPQITKIEWAGQYINDLGHYMLRLKVTGYGHDKAYLDGVPVSSTRDGYFINYGNAADGFYWLYDLGVLTDPGPYKFTVTFTSTNSPNTKMTYNYNVYTKDFE